MGSRHPLLRYGAPLRERAEQRRLGSLLRNKPRDEFVLSTKVGRYIRPGTEDTLVYDYTRDGVRRALDRAGGSASIAPISC